ncbi:probable ADP-ribosylation factor GTPase-activating protein AGD14 isoform X2 [Cynara cardunculus var. scolymus]|uniref:probable ADP-ribosylation factor GTPase-activating protein AGD14 isoform X2 n=1 Tax=Cynara cardunculus var. scolymus TaxID=59895 RepID=UPI000D62CCAF|nr:probable ADP-ribosylation factor GTPase-activating protein AGD14 isoform X2 [Cynara cardunculus var. scolymus]
MTQLNSDSKSEMIKNVYFASKIENNLLGPQYVCTSFWTFVCTTCSGIHREFTHRVKSVSMAKFTSQEVSALQGGGNASAKEIYFKEWDAQRQSFPDSSNVERLRDFIKHVYVDRRYSGERTSEKPPRAKMGEAEDTYQGGSRSPPYENERRYSDRPSPGGRSDGSSRNSYDERRSPGYDQDFRKSPARTDIVNDWRREDRFGNGRRSEDGKISDGGSKVGGRSPDSQRDPEMSSPPIVRPVRDILGESVSPLRVIEPPRASGSRPADGSLQTQRTVSSSSLASSNGNPTELRTESSLIDFDAADPEPPSTAPLPQTQQNAPSPASFMAQPTISSNTNWANFDSAPVVKASQPPSSANLLDVLSELSVPSSLPGGLGAPVTAPGTSLLPSGNNPLIASVQMSPFGTPAPAVTPASTFIPGSGSAGPSFNAFPNSADGGHWQNMHPQQNFLPATVIQPPTSFNQAVGGSSKNQPWNSSLTGNIQVPSSAPSADSQVTSSIEAKPASKQELPADLFTSSYSPFAAQGPGWYPAPQFGMGYNMQYNMPTQPMPPAFVQPSKSSNPFDANESPAVQASTFPSMAALQGALPNMGPPSGHIQQQATPSPMWMPPQSSHPLAMPSQGLPSYPSSMPSGPFMGQVPPNIPPQPSFGYDATSFGSLNTSSNQQQSGLFGAPNTFSSSNPFG